MMVVVVVLLLLLLLLLLNYTAILLPLHQVVESDTESSSG